MLASIISAGIKMETVSNRLVEKIRMMGGLGHQSRTRVLSTESDCHESVREICENRSSSVERVDQSILK